MTAVSASEHVLPCHFPTTLKCLFSWIYLAERSLERWVWASGMTARVFRKHLEIKHISILTERLNNITETQVKTAITDLSEIYLCSIMSHKVCPRASLFFFNFLDSAMLISHCQRSPKVKLGGCRGSQGWWMKPIMQPDRKFLYNVILLRNLFSVWSVTGCLRMTVQSQVTKKTP